MIYGADSPIALPIIDLYDTGAMRMYVDAARELYQQGLKDYETFMSQYGDFTSPFKKDVDYWDKNIMGPVINKINEYYAQGIDPTRNPEARADIARLTRSVPRTTAANMKANAARGEEYLKNLGKLAAQGKFSRPQEDFYLNLMGYPSFEDFSTAENGTWMSESPIEAKSLFDATSPWFVGMTPHDMTKEQVEKAMGPGFWEDGFRYTGIPEQDLYEVVKLRIPGWLDTFEGRFFKKNAEDRLRANGIEPTDENVYDLLTNDIVTANHKAVIDPIGELDPIRKIDLEFNKQAALENLRHQNKLAEDLADMNNKINLYNKTHPDNDDDGSGSGSGRVDKRGNKMIDIFWEADKAGSTKTGHGGRNHVKYLKDVGYEELIDPANNGIIEEEVGGKDNSHIVYKIPSEYGGDALYSYSSVYNLKKGRVLPIKLLKDTEYTFEPVGEIHSVSYQNSLGRNRYFITGTLKKTDENGKEIDVRPNGEKYVTMEVKRRIGEYIGKGNRELSRGKKEAN